MKPMKKHAITWTALALAACGPAGSEAPPPDRSDEMAGREMAGDALAGDGMGEMTAGERIRLTSRQAALAGVAFAVAQESPLDRTVRSVAMAVPDEKTLGIVNARVGGWVEKLYANETGRRVARGEPLLELYAPELVTAQEELLLASRLPVTASRDSLVAAARRRLELWNISLDQIAEIERTGIVRRTLTVRSPYPGHILDKHVIEGQAVRPGDALFRIADLTRLWIEPAIFERDLALVQEGQSARVRFDALPGRSFDARVTFLYPNLDPRTRTLRIRLEVANPDFLIKPGMYGTARIRAAGPPGVVVPLTAVLPTGEGDVAFLIQGADVLPTRVTVGERGDSTVLVTEGIAAGDTVIASATFLFDSESSLAAATQGIMLNMGMGLDMGGMEMEGMERMEGMDAEGMQDGRQVEADTGGENDGGVE